MFDIDNTLTPPRQPINKTMTDILQNLTLPFHVVAGSHILLLKKQFFEPIYTFGLRKKFDAFVSNGAIHYTCDFTKQMSIELVSEFNIRKHLGENNYNFLMEVLKNSIELRDFQLAPHLKIVGETIVDRISMINFCPIGRVEQESPEDRINRSEFVKFDRANGYRQRIMDYLNKQLSSLIDEKELRITLGGETSFDIGIRDYDKTIALRTLLEKGYERLIFIGDALFEGGNDAVIRKFIENWPANSKCPAEAIQTKSWKNTIDILIELKLIS